MYCFGAKLQNNADMGKKIKRKLPISPFFFEIWARKLKDNCPYLYFFFEIWAKACLIRIAYSYA